MPDDAPPQHPPVNPHTQVAPNFASPIYAGVRQLLIDSGQFHSDDEVVQHLLSSWKDDNQAQRDAWDAQQQPPPEQPPAGAAAGNGGAGAANPQQQPEQPIPAPAIAAGTGKAALPPIDRMAPPPSKIDPIPQQAYINQLRERKYVELYPFTPEACAEAASSFRSSDDQALSLVRGSDSGAIAIKTQESA